MRGSNGEYAYGGRKPHLDDAAHAVHDYENPGACGWEHTESKCHICGNPLKAFYTEVRLYLVRCDHCHISSLIEAHNPGEACEIISGGKSK